jgi:hypothetical protein
MSKSDIETAKEAWAALQARDLSGFLEFMDPEIEFNSLVAEAEGGTFRGHNGVREWWKRVVNSLGGLRYDISEPLDLGDGLVLTPVVISGRVADVEVPQEMWNLAKVRNGKAVWWEVSRTEQEARDGAEVRRADG